MKILFVCMGNICRSPAGEIVFRHLVAEAKLTDKVTIDSAGTIGFHTGKGPDARMSETLRKRNYTITGSSRKITSDDLQAFDLILAMDHDNYEDIMQLAESTPDTTAEIKLFTDYCTEHDDTFVPDPYYGGQDGFEYVADLMEDGCQKLLSEIK